MHFGVLSTTWAALRPGARIAIVADSARWPLAHRIREDNLPCASRIDIFHADNPECFEPVLRTLTQEDLLVALLTVDGFMNKGHASRFPPFDKPTGLACKYAFVRLDIPERSLLTGLHTPSAKVRDIIKTYGALRPGRTVRVTAPGGTDITAAIAGQDILPWEARHPGGHAFLPPAEISEELVPAAANGVIVADITVGELRFGPELIDPLGIVDAPVRITVRDGLVEAIESGWIAERLRDGLAMQPWRFRRWWSWGTGCRTLRPSASSAWTRA